MLGQPNRIFTKLDDKLKIHSQATSSSPANDYFFNYFDRGLDVLFDSQRHTAKKFVLHSNSPHDVNFNRYSKVSMIIGSCFRLSVVHRFVRIIIWIDIRLALLARRPTVHVQARRRRRRARPRRAL